MSALNESSGVVTVSGLTTVNAMPINIHGGSGSNKPVSFFSGSDGLISLNVNVSGGVLVPGLQSGHMVIISGGAVSVSGSYVSVASSGVGLSHYSGALNVNISGGSVTVNISGGVSVDVSGNVVYVSGQVVRIASSGGIPYSDYSGALNVNISGGVFATSVSGNVVRIASSGSILISDYSGALNVNISGGTLSATVSGTVVRISSSGGIPYTDYSGALNVNISGGVFATNVSGNVVRVASSGSVIITDYSGALNVNTVRRLDRVQVTWSGNATSFSLSSGVTAYSDEFYGLYAASGATGNAFGLYNTVVLGVNTSGYDKSGTATFAIFGRFVSGGTVYQDGLGIISGTAGYLLNYKSGQGATTTLGFLPSFSFILSSIAQVSGETVTADLIGLV